MNVKSCYFEVRGFRGSHDSGWVVFEGVCILFGARIMGVILVKVVRNKLFSLIKRKLSKLLRKLYVFKRNHALRNVDTEVEITLILIYTMG